jgi:hypothetical protein
MVPTAIMKLERLPRLLNGKVDRHSLPPVTPDHVVHNVHFLAPGTELERIIAQTWEEVLKVERVGLMDDFFALGGDSLAAVRVTMLLQERVRPNLAVDDLLVTSTLAEFCAAVQVSMDAEVVAG